MIELNEFQITLISQGTLLEGTLNVSEDCRISGKLIGKLIAKSGTKVTLTESGCIEGQVFADSLVVNGYIDGVIHAKTSVFVSNSARVIGSLETPKLTVESGAFFEATANTRALAASGADKK